MCHSKIQYSYILAFWLTLGMPDALALTFKKDGSVVQKSGNIVSDSYANRFLLELKTPTKNWQKSTGRAKPIKGYFGDDIFLPGAPLLRIEGIRRGEEYLEAVYRLNGFAKNESLYRYIVANATPEFIAEIELSEDDVQAYLDSSLTDFVVESGLVETELGGRIVEAQELVDARSTNISNFVEDAVNSAIEKEIEESVSEAVQEAVEAAVDNWLDALIEKYNIDPGSIIEIGDGWVATTH